MREPDPFVFIGDYAFSTRDITSISPGDEVTNQPGGGRLEGVYVSQQKIGMSTFIKEQPKVAINALRKAVHQDPVTNKEAVSLMAARVDDMAIAFEMNHNDSAFAEAARDTARILREAVRD